MRYTPRLHKAFTIAAKQHEGQRRKTDDIPYVMHPTSVAFIVSQYTDDEDIVIASLLHDVLEDTMGYTPTDMTRDFGARVTQLVQEVTEPEKKPDFTPEQEKATWETRKQHFLEHLRKASPDALMITAADKMHNMISMLLAYEKMGVDAWQKFNAPLERRLWFHSEVVKLVQEKLQNPIADELTRIYTETSAGLDSSMRHT